MKINRHKKLNKILNFFQTHYQYHAPYQILIDGTFCEAARKVSNSEFLYSVWIEN